MTPAVTILQLDTAFPRVPGDVAAAQTYRDEIEIIRIPGATVGQVVSADPAAIPIAPFEAALKRARGDVIATSCGFLAYWQEYLAARCDRPFISSALTALPNLCESCPPRDILALTFDADRLNAAHYGALQPDVVGLPPDAHLRQVIAQGLPDLDIRLAAAQLAELVGSARKAHHKHLLLECTNLPPYKRAIGQLCDLPITDVLTCIETARPGTVRAEFLTDGAP